MPLAVTRNRAGRLSPAVFAGTARTAAATDARGRVDTATCGTPSVSSEKKSTSLSVWRRSRSASALSSFEAATTMPKGALVPGPATGTPTA